jgi:hypothetical protein
MPLPNFHSARVIGPDRFARIVTLRTLPNGIQILGGPLKTNPSGQGKPQAYRFPKSKFTVDQAKKWLKENNINFVSFEAAKETQAFDNSVDVIISCKQIHAFNQSEIIDMIPSDVLAQIKAKDPRPFFQAYVLCHEGTSTPKILNEESKPITWTRKAIQSIKNIVTKGVKFFFGHNSDSSTKNRRVLGEVVANVQKEIDGKLSHIVISHHPQEVKEEVKKYDICSQEAKWNLIDTAKGLVADTIQKLTGIAFQSSENDSPAFAGAKRLGMVQAFNDKSNLSGELKMPEEKILTLNDVRIAVRDLGLYPNQLFTLDQMKEDREFSKVISENEQLKTDLEAKEEAIKTLETEKTTLTKKQLASTAKIRLKTIMKSGDTTITDNQKLFMENNFSEDQEDLSDEGLKAYIASQLKFLEKNNNIIDFKEHVDSTDLPAGTPPEGDVTDQTKAENNPLLEEDFNIEEQ